MTPPAGPAASARDRMRPLLAATRRAEERHFWFRGLRRFVRVLLERAAAGRRDLRLLDCGCGTGANLRLAGEFGLACGLEISRAGLEFARSYGERQLVRASIAQIPFPDDAFDVVLALDVLYALEEWDEHLAVVEMRRVLRPGGAAIVNVAALPLLRGTHAAFGHELRRSTRRRLRAVLAAGGLAVERVTYTNFTLFPLMLAVRLGQRLAGLASPEEAGIDTTVPPAPVNETLNALLAIEGLALRHLNMPIGSSLLCLARKPADPDAP